MGLVTDSTRNKLAAWAGNQQPNGMLAEQIHNANPDQPEGRIMSDSTVRRSSNTSRFIRNPHL